MIQRLHIGIRGAVQGVGFRPFVYRLATDMRLPGWVLNSPQGVFTEVEGEKATLDRFLLRLEKEKPPRAFIQSLEFSFLDPVGFRDFEIRRSDGLGDMETLVLPDIATCPDCLREIFDPANRRYLYPFTNCTNCGPRFTIIESLPYDRPNTSMRKFTMCLACHTEYENPLDRRFHAQPNACPACGPQLEYWDESGVVLSMGRDALRDATKAVRSGMIVAVKGLGGFHLVVDAANDAAVIRLRARKRRNEKPLALMYPSLEAINKVCRISEFEKRLLLSPESPIVLLQRKLLDSPLASRDSHTDVAPSVAPRNPYLGVMLPYTPLHHILMKELGFPVVATSGNLSDEPICTDEYEALDRLHTIADGFLFNNRPVVRHVDDSVVRVMMGREMVIRRARGYAPLPITLNKSVPQILAVGGQSKNAVALSAGKNVFVSQHIGDLETKEAYEAFLKVIEDLCELYRAAPQEIVCDLHPDYLSTRYARMSGSHVIALQHHYAHIASCMAENELEGRVLGVSWDGTGYGTDGTIWGGEFLLTSDHSACHGEPLFHRVASFRRFLLPGGAIAVKEPRRTALGVLYEMMGEEVFRREDLRPVRSFSPADLLVIRRMLTKGLNSPVTSSAGRLFDAVASLVGLRQEVNFEGQAAMELEFALEGQRVNETYPFCVSDTVAEIDVPLPPHARITTGASLSRMVIDWEPIIRGLLEDVEQQREVGFMAAKFHNTLAEIILEVARRTHEQRVVLSGGCFQNRYLTERTVRRLQAEGFRPYWHQRVPPNDGGIALGQVFAACLLMERTPESAAKTNLEAGKRTALVEASI